MDKKSVGIAMIALLLGFGFGVTVTVFYPDLTRVVKKEEVMIAKVATTRLTDHYDPKLDLRIQALVAKTEEIATDDSVSMNIRMFAMKTLPEATIERIARTHEKMVARLVAIPNLKDKKILVEIAETDNENFVRDFTKNYLERLRNEKVTVKK